MTQDDVRQRERRSRTSSLHHHVPTYSGSPLQKPTPHRRIPLRSRIRAEGWGHLTPPL